MMKSENFAGLLRFVATAVSLVVCALLSWSLTAGANPDIIVQWSKVSGPGEAIFQNPSDPKTKVRFTQPGKYVLRLTAKVGNETSQDDTEITVEDDSPMVTDQGVVKWPIEIMGASGEVESVSFDVPNLTGPTQVSRIWFRTHNVTYDNKMSFSLNGGPWIPVQNNNVILRKMDHVTGGFGGGHSTHEFTMDLQGTPLKNGGNEIRFRFTSRPGEGTSGYRVLRFNFLRGDGSSLMSESSFVEDAPGSWGAIFSDDANIAEGKRLWESADLTHPGFPQGHIIRAHCMDCHSRDGRDLKYFNYSNKSIVRRSMFHGLSEKQGQQIASYIRTLDTMTSVNARPWNPPYQPGPGMDSKPVSEWAAGAGESAVLDDFEDMYPHLFPEAANPDGSVDPSRMTGQSVSIENNVNFREIPIPMQLPDWNSWLPSIHPVDATGDFFLNHPAHARYKLLHTRPLRFASRDEWFFFQNDISNYTKIDNWPNYPATSSHNLHASPRHSRETYDASLWGMVKAWEIMQEKELEGTAASYFGKYSPVAEGPGWFTNMAFFTSPNMLGLPAENHGLRDGSKVTRFFYSYIWYHLQAVLYAGQGVGNPINPIDWPYVYGFLANMPFGMDKSVHQVKPSPLAFLWLAKVNQLSNNTIKPQSGFNNSPQIHLTQPKPILGAPSIESYYFSNEPAHNKSVEILVHNWLDLIEKYTPAENRMNDRVAHAKGFSFPANLAQMNALYHNQTELILSIFYTGHKVKAMGLSPQVHQRMKSVLQPIFNQPNIPWDKF